MIQTTAALRFPSLGMSQQRGRKPRCHLLTSGDATDVARRLTSLLAPWAALTADDRHWMPAGFERTEEAQLDKTEMLIGSTEMRVALRNWWLAAGDENTRTPHWDVAARCKIEGRDGILLIEAKAHEAELRNEERGKPLGQDDGKGVSIGSRRNHLRIGACIADASLALAAATGLPWALSRDWNYQMANRFAWAWRLTTMGIPVVLVYLGFLHAHEVGEAITGPEHWERLVTEHSRTLSPAEVWNRRWELNGQTLIPLIRTLDIPLAPQS